MPPIRLGSLMRLIFAISLSLGALHILSASLGPNIDYETEEGSWSETLGLDHYADWEAGVTGKLGDGLGRVKDSLGAIRGGFSWGSRGTKLGSLFELVSSSNPVPRPAYFDERSSFDRLRLTSTRVLGHGIVDPDKPEIQDESDDAPVNTGKRNRRHILVTGGFGSLGKHVIRDMLLGLGGDAGRSLASWSGKPGEETSDEDIFITLLDVVDRSAELNFLLQAAPNDTPLTVKGTDPRTSAFTTSERSVSNFRRSGKLRIVIGDVRDETLVRSILETNTFGDLPPKARRPKANAHVVNVEIIPTVSGIIHLATYSPSDCKLNPVDCEAIETGGMTAILNSFSAPSEHYVGARSATRAHMPSTERPWMIMPRRRQGWVDHMDAYNRNASSLSLYAAHNLLKDFSTSHPFHSLLLTLPSQHSFVGDPHAARSDPVPHIVQSALGHLPIQVISSPEDPNESFIAVEDASRSIIQGARMLELASKKGYVREMAFVAELEIVGPLFEGQPGQFGLAEVVVSLTRSESALAHRASDSSGQLRPSDARRIRNAGHRKRALSALGFTPTTSMRLAIKSYIGALLRMQAMHLASRISVACSSPPAIPVLEEGLLALSGCNVQLLTIIEGSYYTLGCSAGVEEVHSLPISLLHAIPFKEGVRGVEILAERGAGEGKVDLQIRCPIVDKDGNASGQADVVVWTESISGGAFAEASKPGARTIAEWYSVDFVQRDSRSFTLTLPPTEDDNGEEPKRRLTMHDSKTGGERQLHFQAPTADSRTMLWKVNPICCPNANRRKDVWDFFKEDPVITSQVTFPSEDGRTSLTESTLSIQRCRDLRAEHESIAALRQWLRSSTSETPCVPKRGEANSWAVKDLPICSIDCGAPLVCIVSDLCRCTQDRCGDRRALGSFPAVAYSNSSSFPLPDAPKSVRPTLVERVAQIPWDAIILPGARLAFNTPLNELPRAHVVDLPDTIDTHMKSEACYNIDKSPLPFMGDHVLIEALRNQSVEIEAADFVMVPYYQGCYYNYLQENTFKKLADTIAFAETRIAAAEHITASKIAIPFTHDFGSCTGWWPRLEDVLGRTPPIPMDQAIAWQVNGDYNTRCIKPDRDVVIPAITKHTKALTTTFGNISAVATATDRPYLAFFAGGVRGFGAVARTRIGCGRVDTPNSKILYQKYAPGQRYLGTLNSAKFCLLPRGIPAWSTRTFEAIYAGCIPAFIVDRNSFPFQDILDYSLFSVTIPETDAHRVEEILETYDDETIFQLQAHLLRAREAFLFQEGKEWERKGPLFFSLVSMQMRLALNFPLVGGCLKSTMRS